MTNYIYKIMLSDENNTEEFSGDEVVFTHKVNYQVKDFLKIVREAKNKSNDYYTFVDVMQKVYGFNLCVQGMNTVVHFKQ